LYHACRLAALLMESGSTFQRLLLVDPAAAMKE
jgi:hypothetical protein